MLGLGRFRFGIFQLGFRNFSAWPLVCINAKHGESSPPSRVLSATNHEQTLFFFLVFRYKLTTPSFFVMTQGTEAIDGVRQQKECCPWRPFLRTVHLDAHDIAVRPEHFVLMQELRSSRPCVKVTLPLDVLLELQNEALIEPAFPHRKASRLASCSCVGEKN